MPVVPQRGHEQERDHRRHAHEVGEGAGDHARAAGAYLTGVHPKKTEGTDIRAGVSMDQIAARVLGNETQLASLELSLDSREPVGACDPGYSCAYANTLSWRSPTTPLPMGPAAILAM